jgi:hypothetical protein
MRLHKQRFGISLLVIMKNILAKFLRAHQQHEAWWFKIKIVPNADSNEASPLDEAPGEYCLSKLLGIPMNDLWEVLIATKMRITRLRPRSFHPRKANKNLKMLHPGIWRQTRRINRIC